jgi:hypothetical protein
VGDDQAGVAVPGAVAYGHALEAGLSALNPVVHPAGVLLNAGRIERSRGEFWFYEEGVTPGVVAAIRAVDGERRALGAALGLELAPVAEAFARAGSVPPRQTSGRSSTAAGCERNPPLLELWWSSEEKNPTSGSG